MGFDVILNLGVMDVAYADKDTKGAATTGEVAEILEKKYHVMETFAELNRAAIGKFLAASVAKAIESVLQGSPVNALPTMDAEQRIEHAFRSFLDADVMSQTVASLSISERNYFMDSVGTFDGAASRGVSHRKKHPFSRKNKPRPAFIDTGLYQASFRAWVSEE